MKKIVHVAAAVITRQDGSFLLGQRAAETFYPNFWEFPGGKVEPGETPYQALVRELQEELGITVTQAWPWIRREHVYKHAHVSLHFFEVSGWEGEPQGHVHSALAWQQADALAVGPMLPANGPILKALRLPRVMAITQAATYGISAQLEMLDRALADGLRLVQLREPGLPAAERTVFLTAARAQCEAAGAIGVCNEGDALTPGVAERHLPARVLMRLRERPEGEWVGASCHNRAELEQAAALGLDYAVLGHVLPTPSHVGQPPLGWAGFAERVAGLSLPVFAIGGVTPADMEIARAHGAHGIAMMRGAWEGLRA
ncbi:MAG: DNA mismatch repair protein MutT [Candidatus Dactylopiibacterium carminicum]|uniref:8-oxo-dGTP diphosphatase n=1 Tax=Candidatus Dactylopiibacterium carminicum TaxID=857335 RepID=A0A272EX15_9RHOO|nr:Nudix family hydrolase [Candidatus Dactylopiibacterium carminicum]KAF7600292.1 DNA mismatch repair protein MutT [Candidatus Dactylopiibacterium carminicum]PAS94654.1 MAG: DNA mismatch repair protein MutT [Candidatus Dactylopiibacterium carminicum]PAS96996.1 MAG: DNA mismatch repair protein MutT [Candidatus Dactylopiibacterium carminicum]PAT00293.1 MAG: DNA mismatch repair protein MutT [Candidatus Dactylopiibacterium carminicum]